jgi:hypothetical protein
VPLRSAAPSAAEFAAVPAAPVSPLPPPAREHDREPLTRGNRGGVDLPRYVPEVYGKEQFLEDSEKRLLWSCVLAGFLPVVTGFSSPMLLSERPLGKIGYLRNGIWQMPVPADDLLGLASGPTRAGAPLLMVLKPRPLRGLHTI